MTTRRKDTAEAIVKALADEQCRKDWTRLCRKCLTCRARRYLKAKRKHKEGR
jgi:hypothetical protein